MKYVPKEIEENVNVSSTHPLKEFFVLLGGALGLLVVVYVVLGFAVDLVVHRLPAEVEEGLGAMYSGMYGGIEETEEGKRLQELLESLTEEFPDGRGHYSVHFVNSPVVNAMALPGGNIVVYSGLVEELESENELAFVLAHELGHFENRDHLRGLGRGLVLVVISATVLGHDNEVTRFLMSSLTNVEMKFSQRQELQADSFALDLLNRKYGHAAGSADFFARLSEKKKRSRLSHYFATHPHPEDRVKALEKRMLEKGYTVKEKTPLDEALKEGSGGDSGTE